MRRHTRLSAEDQQSTSAASGCNRIRGSSDMADRVRSMGAAYRAQDHVLARPSTPGALGVALPLSARER